MSLNPRGLHPSDESGAFDLPSVITGVVVVGVLTAGVLASVFGVIPFAQDNGARQDLAAVRTAQGVHKATKNGFTDKDGLRGANLLNDLPEQMLIAATGDGAKFCASTVSPTGRTFILTSEMGQPEESTTGGCGSSADSAWAAGAGAGLASRVNFAATPSWSSGYIGPATGKGYFGSLASSADGTRLVAGQGYDDYYGLPGSAVFLSADAGVTWSKASGLPSGSYESAASSADGRILYVAQGHVYPPSTSNSASGKIWRSEDFGATWTAITAAGSTSTGFAGNGNWQGLAASADGQTVVALEGSDYVDRGLWVSHDAGRTFTHRPSTAKGIKWLDVSVSADGQTIVSATLVPDGTWGWGTGDTSVPEVSTDGGATWAFKTVNGKSQGWTRTAVSADGKTILASDYTGARFYRSTDTGTTWTQLTMPEQNTWTHVGDIALSADGSKAIVGKSTGSIWVSVDSGATWVQQVGPGSAYWDSVAITADGASFSAASSSTGGKVVTGTFPAK